MSTLDVPALKFNLTPASDGLAVGGDAEGIPGQTHSQSPSQQHQQYLSSTRASVDSDSEYQYAQTSTTATQVPSRPTSPTSSTMSALSTTALAEGVEGKRVHRFHDPLGYARWLKQTQSTAIIDGDSKQIVDSDGEEEREVSESESVENVHDNYVTSQPSPQPPNVPTSPPVTMSEKMRLMRTGSVSGSTLASQEYDELSPALQNDDSLEERLEGADFTELSGRLDETRNS